MHLRAVVCARSLGRGHGGLEGAGLHTCVPWSICGLIILDGIADVTVLAGGGLMAVGLMFWLAMSSTSLVGARCGAIGALSGGNETGSSWPGGSCWAPGVSSATGCNLVGIAALVCSVAGCGAAPATPGVAFFWAAAAFRCSAFAALLAAVAAFLLAAALISGMATVAAALIIFVSAFWVADALAAPAVPSDS